jgi:hypothetical protein
MHPAAATADAGTAASEMRSAAKMGTAAATHRVGRATAAPAVETTTAAAVETTTTTTAAASSGRGVSCTDQRSGQSNDGKDFEP